MIRHFFGTTLVLLALMAGALQAAPLVTQRVQLEDGRAFNLKLPSNLQISPVAEGMKRIRFFARSPDGRIFLTDMDSLADNSKGKIYVLENRDAQSGRYRKITTYLSGLRNPNDIAFYRDAKGQQWLYVALTDRLVRYPYRDGDVKPGGKAQTLATYPDYGLSYKYGGWHLTRSIAFGKNGKLYVSVGSSCNACIEKETVRATVMEYDPDGSNGRVFAKGLRNAVGMFSLEDGSIVVSNQGADHLGINLPNETLFKLKESDYGWPHCYFDGLSAKADPKFPRKEGCHNVPRAFAYFDAHASALGVAYFDGGNSLLKDQYLVALHGATNKKVGHGYKVVRVDPNGGRGADFITGWLQDGVVNGRPCGIMQIGKDSFLLTDDKYGVVYWVRPK